jgi:hypothetical protein
MTWGFMNARHTQGPWITDIGTNVNGDQFVWPSTNGRFCGHSIAKIYGAHRDKTPANARLIAAAPELLAACETVLSEHDTGATADEIDWHVIRNAIAKAKGE